jgi:hypothetical protein
VSAQRTTGPAFDTIAKVAAGTVVACYVAGLITVSAYLYSVKVSIVDPAALRARFAYTGGGILLLVVVSVGFGALALTFLGARFGPVAPGAPETASRSWDRRQRVVAIAKAVPVALIPWIAISGVLHWAGRIPLSRPDLYGRSLLVWASALIGGGVVMGGVQVLLRPASAGTQPASSRAVGTFLLSSYGLVFLLYFAWLASHDLYPFVATQFGGGRPESIRLVLSGKGAAVAGRFGIGSEGSPAMSDPVCLIWRDKDFVAVRTSQNKIVELDKALLLASQSETSGAGACAPEA